MPFNPHKSSFFHVLSHALFAFIACVMLAPAEDAFAQNNQDKASYDLSQLQLRPIYVTTRVFQLKAKRGSYTELSDQAFKMKTSKLTEYEDWINAFKKTYPGFEAALLRSDSSRVFRTSKPTVVSLSKRTNAPELEILLHGAQSYGDGVTPGTSLIPEVSLRLGQGKPVTYAIQPLEVESGTTYFFTATNLKMSSTDYVRYIRSNAPVEQFDGNDIYLLLAFSVDLDKTTQPARYLDERQSVELQNGATKKVQPEVPQALRDAGLSGFIRVRIEISTDGKVTSANIHNSNFPEMNAAVIAAARQWEFPTTLFAENKNPITGFLTFNFAPTTPAKAPTQNSDKR